MDAKEFEELKLKLQENFFLIKKAQLWFFIGGLASFLFAAGLVSYQSVLKAVESTGANATLNEIKRFKSDAENTSGKIKQIEKDYSEKLKEVSNINVKNLKEDVEKLKRRLPKLNMLENHHFDMRTRACRSYFKTLTKEENVICTLTGITGGYSGDGEFAKVVLENGVWNFRGNSCQPYVEAWVTCFKIE